MQSFGVIHTRYWMWTQEENLTPEQTVVGAYLLTCPHGNSLGCFRCPPEYVSADVGYPIDTVSKAYLYLIEKGFIAYCYRTKHVFLCKYLHWNPLQNEKHGKGTAKLVMNLPEKLTIWDKLKESLEKYASDRLPQEAFDTVSDRVCHTVSKAYRYTGTETGTNTGTGTGTETSSAKTDCEPADPECEEEASEKKGEEQEEAKSCLLLPEVQNKKPEPEYEYATGKKLKGKRLEWFERFWESFGDKRGKGPAAKSWDAIPELTDSLCQQIVNAAIRYRDIERPALVQKDGTPKMAQGWLTDRRWEDDPQALGGHCLLPGGMKSTGVKRTDNNLRAAYEFIHGE